MLDVEDVKVVESQLISDINMSYTLLKEVEVRRGCAVEKNQLLKRVRELDYDISKELLSNSDTTDSEKLISLRIEREVIVKSLLELKPAPPKYPSGMKVGDSYEIVSSFAKKTCVCNCCSNKIKSKEYYKKESGFYENKPFTRNLCMGCYAIIDKCREDNEKFFNIEDISSDIDLTDMEMDYLWDFYCYECDGYEQETCTISAFTCPAIISKSLQILADKSNKED